MTDNSLATSGGGFLVADAEPQDIFTPEQFSEEQVMIGRTAKQFADEKVRPKLDEMEQGKHQVSVALLREAGSLGLLSADVPEKYSGGGLSKVTSTLVTEMMARGASFAVTFGAHTGIGTLPIVFFGNELQKSRYLPSLANGERIASYALTEPDAGSDAMGIKTIARLSADGNNYVLNGQKQWITNAGFADVFVVYAKVDGTKMTAFIVDRDTEGISIGPEFQKMGLQGSSTCSVYLSDVKVPVENVLGEVGRGHIVAFNILNIGRWKLAAGCVGSCKAVLETAAHYATERRQFGKTLAEFPAIQQKLAQMAARTFALESVVYRTAGLFDRGLSKLEAGKTEGAAEAIAEYGVEASINKVFGSETLDMVVDEAVQIHGGYGYIRGSDVERAYRDARINRIFEGTNEINRMLIPDLLMRRAAKGDLPLMQAIQRAQMELNQPRDIGSGDDGSALSQELAGLANLKRATLLVGGLGFQKYGTHAAEEQEFLMALADLAILTYSLESTLLRARRMEAQSAESPAIDMARLFGDWAFDSAESVARGALAGMEQGDTLQVELALLRRLFKRTPIDAVELGRRLGSHVVSSGGYDLSAPIQEQPASA